MTISAFDRVVNIVRKGENAGQQVSSSSTEKRLEKVTTYICQCSSHRRMCQNALPTYEVSVLSRTSQQHDVY